MHLISFHMCSCTISVCVCVCVWVGTIVLFDFGIIEFPSSLHWFSNAIRLEFSRNGSCRINWRLLHMNSASGFVLAVIWFKRQLQQQQQQTYIIKTKRFFSLSIELRQMLTELDLIEYGAIDESGLLIKCAWPGGYATQSTHNNYAARPKVHVRVWIGATHQSGGKRKKMHFSLELVRSKISC